MPASNYKDFAAGAILPDTDLDGLQDWIRANFIAKDTSSAVLDNNTGVKGKSVGGGASYNIGKVNTTNVVELGDAAVVTGIVGNGAYVATQLHVGSGASANLSMIGFQISQTYTGVADFYGQKTSATKSTAGCTNWYDHYLEPTLANAITVANYCGFYVGNVNITGGGAVTNKFAFGAASQFRQTTVGAAGAAAALPATPVGYVRCLIDSQQVVIPYYNAA